MRQSREEWVHGHLPEAARLATLLTADVERGPRVAEESIAAALQLLPGRRRESRLADAVLTQLVRRSHGGAAAGTPDDPVHVRALRALPYRRRAALVLRHYAELSNERAALFLGCSPRAVGDLASKALEALPPEARANVRDWLDAAPSPRPLTASEHRSVLRRSRRRRAVRALAATLTVAAGVAGGLRIPDLVRAPEPQSAADRMLEVRRLLEAREKDLPFDPDDPGPSTTRLFPVVDGVVGGSLWSVGGYRDPTGSPCLQLVVDLDFGSRRCLGHARGPIRAIVDVSEKHDATFISGMVGPQVDSLTFVGPGVTWMDVTIGHEDPGAKSAQEGFFGIALHERFLPIESRQAGRIRGYRVHPGRLTAMDADGDVVAALDLLLAKPR
ncbi:MAG: hypothetical protein M3271_04775 [Actinomycetota bacterium]|nr:hypothetical protein [Actinomycetota bacterium]